MLGGSLPPMPAPGVIWRRMRRLAAQVTVAVHTQHLVCRVLLEQFAAPMGHRGRCCQETFQAGGVLVFPSGTGSIRRHPWAETALAWPRSGSCSLPGSRHVIRGAE